MKKENDALNELLEMTNGKKPEETVTIEDVKQDLKQKSLGIINFFKNLRKKS